MISWIITVAISFIGFTISGTAIGIAQENQLDDNINRNSTAMLDSTNII